MVQIIVCSMYSDIQFMWIIILSYSVHDCNHNANGHKRGKGNGIITENICTYCTTYRTWYKDVFPLVVDLGPAPPRNSLRG